MRDRFLRALLLGLLAAVPAAAQSLRSLTVPADAAIVVPPRGQPLPFAPAAPQAVAAPLPPLPPVPAATPLLPLAAAPLPLGAVPGLLVPLGAAALLGTGLPGTSGSSAPATTR